MKQHRSVRLLNGLLLGAAITGLVLTCGQKREQKQAAASNMVVVFAFGDAKIIRAGKEIPAKVGMLVNQDDEIKTTNGSVDLQTRNGSAIRVREFTNIQVARLTGGDAGETKISMKHGGLLASVKRKSSKEDFSVVTPTAIAGVRGTTFSVEMDEEGAAPRVKVLQGKVAMAPRIRALEKYEDSEIQANPTLKELATIQQKNEVVLEDATEGTIEANTQQKVTALNEAIESAEAQNQNIAEVATVSQIAKEVDTASNEKAAVVTNESTVTAKEEADAATLVSIDENLVNEVAEGSNQSADAQQAMLEKIQKEREAKQEVVLKKIQDEASKKDLKSEQEIQKAYNKLEVVIMADGTRHTGAVIAQTGNTLVVHTPQGVKRLPKGAVASIEFY